MKDIDKLLPFLEDFSSDDVSSALKGILRRKITYLKKKVRAHANHKEIERNISNLETKIKNLTDAFPDSRYE